MGLELRIDKTYQGRICTIESGLDFRAVPLMARPCAVHGFRGAG
jgi:hypothetical protein